MKKVHSSIKPKLRIKKCIFNCLQILYYVDALTVSSIDMDKSNINKANYSKLEYIQIYMKHNFQKTTEPRIFLWNFIFTTSLFANIVWILQSKM